MLFAKLATKTLRSIAVFSPRGIKLLLRQELGGYER